MEQISFTNRNSAFMQSGLPKTLEEFSNFRSTAAVTLRKQKRQNHILHKRLKKLECSPGVQISLSETLQNLSLSSLASVKAFRKLLCSDKFDFMQLVSLQPNIVSFLAQGLKSSKNELIFELVWCFANLALGIPALVNEVSLLTYEFSEIIILGKDKSSVEQACWVIGNLAADDVHKKAAIRKIPGLVRAIVNLLGQRNSSLASVGCWALCNILRSPNPDATEVLESGGLYYVADLLKRHFSCQVTEALWLLSFIVYAHRENVYHFVYQKDMLDLLLKYLNYSEPEVVLPVIRVLGSGFLSDHDLSSLFSNPLFSETLMQLLTHSSIQLKKEALWLLSNISTSTYIGMLMNYTGDSLLKILLKLIGEDPQGLKTEAGIALYNLAEIFDSAYLPRILELDGNGAITQYTSNIALVPAWVKFDFQDICDVDLLLASLAFISLCLTTPTLPPHVESLLYSSEVRDKIEDCKYTLSKSSPSGPVNQILSLCDFICSRYRSDFEFS